MSDIQSNPYSQPPGDVLFSAEEPPRQPHGCFFYGCIIAIVLAVLCMILVGVLTYVAYSWGDRMIKEYTSTTPVVLPKVNLPDEEREALNQRFKAFKEAVDKGEAAELTLNADEANTLLNEQPNFKDKVYITIKDDKITGQLSLPIDFLPLGMGKGRFLNGSATLTVTLRDGELVVHAREFEVNGKSPPKDLKDQLARENLAKDWAKDRKNAELLSRFDNIEVKDGKIHLKARSKAEVEADADAAREKEKTKDADDAKAKDDDAKAKAKEGDDLPKVDDAKAKAKEGDDLPKVDPDKPKSREDVDPAKGDATRPRDVEKKDAGAPADEPAKKAAA